MAEFDGKVVLVTGAASGIGLATVREFAARGASPVLADINDASGLAAELGGLFVETDVTSPEAVAAAVAAAVERFGHLDIVFNNAGVESHGPLVATDPAEHRRLVDVNINGVYYVLQESIKAMLVNEGPVRGAIVNTASVAGLTGVPFMSSYNATKGAVVLLTRNAAVEYAAMGIRVNAVCPGVIRTPMARGSVVEHGDEEYLEEIGRRVHPLGRIGEPEEVAKVVAFLAGEQSSFISGAAIPVDGAMTAGFPVPDWDGDAV